MAITIRNYTEIDIEMIYGSDLEVEYHWQDQNGMAINIASYTFTFTISATPGGATLLTQAGTITSASNGLWSLKIESTDLASLAPNTDYYYKIQDDDGSGNEYYTIAGKFNQVSK